MKQLKNERGLTLVELLAVIVILAIIAAIAAVAIGNVINNSKDKAILSDAVTIIDGAKIAIMDDVGTKGVGEAADTVTLGKDELTPYVELSEEKWKSGNVETKVTVTEDPTKGTSYKITYGKLNDIKNSKYTPSDLAENTASLEKILEALEGNGTGK